MKLVELDRALKDKYKAEVYKKHNITADQAKAITVEGIKNGWLQ